MRIKKKNRKFKVGLDKHFLTITHKADILLKKDEMINFKFGKSNFDFVKKNWGFYATPSIDKRLKREGFKTAIVKNSFSNIYIMVVHRSKIKTFYKYCRDHKQKIIKWLSK